MDPAPALPAVSRRLTTIFNLVFHHANTVLVMVQAIFLVRLYLARMPEALYGAWLATGNILTYLELVDPGTSDVIRQRVAHHYGASDRAALSRTIGTGLHLSLAFALVPLLAWPAADAAASYARVTGPDAAALAQSFRVGLVGVSLSLASYGLSAVCSGLQLALRSGLFFIGSGVLSIGITVAMLLAGCGLVSIPAGLAARAAMLCGAFGWLVWRWRREHLPGPLRFDRGEARQVLSLSSTTFASRVGTALLDRIDAPLTSRVLGNAQTVVYTLTGRALEPVRMVSASLPTSLMPSLAHMVGAGERQAISRVVALVLRATGTLLAVGAGSVVALDAVFVRVWVGPSRFGGPTLAALLALSVSFTVSSLALNRVAYSLGAIRQAAWVSLVEAAVKVPLQYLLLRRFGLAGMPVAACLGALAVSSWYLPTVVARQLDEAPRVHILRQAGNVARVVAAVLLGRALHGVIARLPVAWNIPRFAVAAVAVGALFGALGLATDEPLRERVRAAVRRR